MWHGPCQNASCVIGIELLELLVFPVENEEYNCLCFAVVLMECSLLTNDIKECFCLVGVKPSASTSLA